MIIKSDIFDKINNYLSTKMVKQVYYSISDVTVKYFVPLSS